MKRPFAITSLLLAWLCANGALLDAVQVFAWGKMFAGYVKIMPARAALQATFDPTSRCDLCLGVANARADLEQKNVPATPEQAAAKLVLALETPPVLVWARPAIAWTEPADCAACTRREAVPVPPPRA